MAAGFRGALARDGRLSAIVGAMRRSALLVATWSAGTLLAVTLAWWAVGRVSSEVVDRPAAPLSNREVATALGVDGGGSTTTTAPAGAGGPTGPGGPGGSGPSPGTPGAPGAATTVPTVPPTSIPRPTTAPGATSTSSTSSPPTSVPATTAPAVSATTATIDSVGGQVAVRYDAGRVELVWARPKAGFEAEVHDAGPDSVEVRFRSDDHESRIRAFFSGGVPDREVREDGDGGSGPG